MENQVEKAKFLDTQIKQAVLHFHFIPDTVKHDIIVTNRYGIKSEIQRIKHKGQWYSFTGIVLPTDEEETINIAIGASKLNSKSNEFFKKRIGRDISKGRALTKPMIVLSCPVAEARQTFVDACLKIKSFVGDFYVSKDKTISHTLTGGKSPQELHLLIAERVSQ